MTTELEKQFFDTFGIEHEERYYNCKDNLEGKCMIKCPCECCNKSEEIYCYPEITDETLLKLICINNSCAFEQKTIIWEEVIMPTSYKYLKESVLSLLMLHKKDFSELKHQVQQLFKEQGN